MARDETTRRRPDGRQLGRVDATGYVSWSWPSAIVLMAICWRHSQPWLECSQDMQGRNGSSRLGLPEIEKAQLQATHVLFVPSRGPSRSRGQGRSTATSQISLGIDHKRHARVEAVVLESSRGWTRRVDCFGRALKLTRTLTHERRTRQYGHVWLSRRLPLRLTRVLWPAQDT